MKTGLLFMICFTVLACNTNKKSTEQLKQEIVKTEYDFAQLAKQSGIYEAFMTYADSTAVLLRNDSLIIGKNNIKDFYHNQNAKGLDWKPDYVFVSKSGDIGYTYGHYTFNYKNSEGKTLVSRGIFHTIWKRQADGSWRFVWD